MALLNGKEAGFVNLTLFGFNLILDGSLGIDYTYQRAKRPVYGLNGRPIYTVSGERLYTGTLRLLRSQYDTVAAGVIQQTGNDLMALQTTLLVSYAPAGELRVTDTLEGVEFTEIRKRTLPEAPYFTVELPFIALRMTETYL